MCAAHKDMLTIFRLGDKNKHDYDYAILTALLKVFWGFFDSE